MSYKLMTIIVVNTFQYSTVLAIWSALSLFTTGICDDLKHLMLHHIAHAGLISNLRTKWQRVTSKY